MKNLLVLIYLLLIFDYSNLLLLAQLDTSYFMRCFNSFDSTLRSMSTTFEGSKTKTS